jgi:large subunit ribosomal protein L25
LQNQLDLEVKIRETRGKNEARRTRSRGEVPGVLYGLGKDSISVVADSKEMTTLLRSPSGRNRILNLNINGEKTSAMAVDWQIDPVQGILLHVDIQRVDLKTKVHARVPVVPVGVAVGVKEEAGLVEQISREVEVECLPLEVPSAIEIDITDLHIGDAIRVKDLPVSDAYTHLSRSERIVVHVVAPKVEQEEEATADLEALDGVEAPDGEDGSVKEEDKAGSKEERE